MPITITIRQNGPLLISAADAEGLRLVDHEGTEVPLPGPGKAVALCRCGASTKKPFCDGTHSRIGFKGAEDARALFDAARDEPPGKNTVGG